MKREKKNPTKDELRRTVSKRLVEKRLKEFLKKNNNKRHGYDP